MSVQPVKSMARELNQIKSKVERKMSAYLFLFLYILLFDFTAIRDGIKIRTRGRGNGLVLVQSVSNYMMESNKIISMR